MEEQIAVTRGPGRYKISCMKRVASPGSMHDTGCLGLVHWDDPEGWNGEGGGRRVQDGVFNASRGPSPLP